MKSGPIPVEVLHVRGGLATSAAFSVDPHEDPEVARAEAVRRSRRAQDARRKKRRRLERLAAGGAADPVAAYEARVRALTAPSADEMAAQMLAEALEGLDVLAPKNAAIVANVRRKVDPYAVAIERLRIAQKRRCVICTAERRLQVDHDHETGLVRGLLCRSCNLIEGKGGGEVLEAYRRTPPSSVLGIVERYRHPFGPRYERAGHGLYALPRAGDGGS